MPRIRPLTREEAAPESKPHFDKDVETYGQVLNTTGVYAYRPTIQSGAKALGQGVQASGLIPNWLRCLINVRIASQVGCPY